MQKHTIQRLENQLFLRREVLYRRTLDLDFLRCVDGGEANRLVEEIHGGTCIPHVNSFTLAKKIMRSVYFLLTMEIECIRYA